MSLPRALTVLGIETSCDETAAAVVRGAAPGPGEILSDIVLSQFDMHAPFGGVVPEIAARAHIEALDTLIEEALAHAQLDLSEIDAIAATSGPGLIGGLMVGLTTAKALALAAGKPLVAINHLEAHALTVRLTDGVAFPYLLLLISGGHC
jgi:N6-L-threonylcarbamoyladenine synthase